jgi:predicted Zn-dependent protease
MTFARREFLKTLGITAGAAVLVDLLDHPLWSSQGFEAAPRSAGKFAPPLSAEVFKALADVAFSQARTLGCAYADIWIRRCRSGSVSLRTRADLSAGRPRGSPNPFSAVIESESFEFGMQVIHSGAWGFARSPSVVAASPGISDEVARLTARAVETAHMEAKKGPPVLPRRMGSRDCWITPDPEDHLAALINKQLAATRVEKDLKGVPNVGWTLTFRSEEKYFVSTTGLISRATRVSVA